MAKIKYNYMDPMSSGGSSLDYEESEAFNMAPETQTYYGPGYSATSASMAEPVAKAAVTAPFMSTPQGAAAVIGSQFLSDFLKQKAAAQEAAFQREQQRVAQKSEGEKQGYQTMLGAWGRALR